MFIYAIRDFFRDTIYNSIILIIININIIIITIKFNDIIATTINIF